MRQGRAIHYWMARPFLFSRQPVGYEGKIVSQSIKQRIPKYQFDTLEFVPERQITYRHLL